MTGEKNIYDIIIGYFDNEELDEMEKLSLDQWLKSRKENQEYFKLLRRMYCSGEGINVGHGVNIDGEFRKTECLLAKRQRNRRLIWCGKVAACLFILIGCGFLFKFSTREHYFSFWDRNIEKSKIVLKLSDGKTIDLNKEGDIREWEEIPGVSVSCQNNSLIYIPKKVEDSLQNLQFNTLSIPAGKEYILLLPDGTKVFLNSMSELKYPVCFVGNKREVWLKGEAYFEVSKDSLREFHVHTDMMNVKVLGTSFNVNAYPASDLSMTTLVSGKVEVMCDGETFMIHPGEQFYVDLKHDKTGVRSVNQELYVSWKNGYYYFDGATLDEIMITLSRWYGVEVFFEQPDLKELTFTGRLKRYDSLESLLSKFEQTRDIHFLLKKNSVFISR